MTTDQVTYLVFGIVLTLAIIIDLGLFTKKGATISLKNALWTSIFWIALGLGFGIFVWFEQGQDSAIEYLSAYLMEKSLSIDNIFVFILIFSAFGVKEKYYGRVLFLGVLMAIIFRIIFITVGVALVEKFHWILYVFGVFLVYTGYKMFAANHEEEFDPHKSKVYKFLKSFLPLAPHDGGGKYIIRENGRPVYTTLFVVVIMLAAIDVVFAVDSIPAVMGISRDKLIIYTSNIFAVLGLRSLFFLLRGAVSKFDFLQQGIALVLVFIGLKMLGEKWINEWMDKTTQVFLSLGVIILCITGSIFYSIFINKKGLPKDVEEREEESVY
jgi:tellurite resistance protein TerC